MIASANIFDHENPSYSILHPTQEVLSLVNEYAHFKNAYLISNCGESPMALTQWECSWIAKYFYTSIVWKLTLACNPRYCTVNFGSIIITSHDWYDMHHVLELTCLSSSLQSYWTPSVPGTVEQASWLRLSLRGRRTLSRSKHGGE